MPTLEVGQQLEPLVVESIDVEKMKTMAAILQDPNPIHYDADLVRELGMGDAPVNQGPINLALLMEAVCRFGGGPDSLKRIRVRFLGNVFGGERYECTGKVVAIDGDIAELEVGATANGRPVLAGTASVKLG
ncbi:MAG: protein dehydratase [Solirubrobacterales bacterium]|nr:protein dehydratase [Solirubrobacterales bacterium]